MSSASSASPLKYRTVAHSLGRTSSSTAGKLEKNKMHAAFVCKTSPSDVWPASACPRVDGARTKIVSISRSIHVQKCGKCKRMRSRIIPRVLGSCDSGGERRAWTQFGAESLRRERLFVLETNIDDLSPQVMAYTMEQLMSAGGLDVWAVPVIMKKGRPGTVLKVLCEATCVDLMLRVILTETSTLGVRVHRCERVSTERDTEVMETRWGHPVRVKVARVQDTVTNVHAEYEDCAEIAQTEGVPLKEVFREALDAYYLKHPVHMVKKK